MMHGVGGGVVMAAAVPVVVEGPFIAGCPSSRRHPPRASHVLSLLLSPSLFSLVPLSSFCAVRSCRALLSLSILFSFCVVSHFPCALGLSNKR